MPNHCSNSLTVTGPDAERFFAAIERQTDSNFIDQFIPMPELLRGASTGGNTIDGEYVKIWRTDEDGKAVKIPDIELALAIDLYGTYDWYEWCRANWGTKWGAYDVTVDAAAGRIAFDSAWAPPVPAIEKISQKFPKATFVLAFAEGGACFYGYTTFENGALIDTDESDQFWIESTGEEEEVEGDIEDSLTPECRAHLETYGLHTGG